MALLTLHGASLSFSDFPLLDHAELTIERGERLCLVGRNGAGKSTLMNHLILSWIVYFYVFTDKLIKVLI